MLLFFSQHKHTPKRLALSSGFCGFGLHGYGFFGGTAYI
jgi:hypothetical protein